MVDEVETMPHPWREDLLQRHGSTQRVTRHPCTYPLLDPELLGLVMAAPARVLVRTVAPAPCSAR
jgi:hypothetical protein